MSVRMRSERVFPTLMLRRKKNAGSKFSIHPVYALMVYSPAGSVSGRGSPFANPSESRLIFRAATTFPHLSARSTYMKFESVSGLWDTASVR